ncbi:hypothetical protein [uncultured Caulobacter sp.]|uniref:hypothetical protein n=1 Tax=uncultured Caulobacter sp. TaxID=158749 RepID=UPI0026142A2C|nr:hypothetical protein [uncultured Caulobacter sp.]
MRTGSTGRVLNLVAIAAESGHLPDHLAAPLFGNRILNTSIILKHRLRADELYLYDYLKPSATKIIIPFDRKDLGLGGQSVFVGQYGWAEMLQEATNAQADLSRDIEVLQLLDELPSLDPFVMREHLRRSGVTVGDSYFALSKADSESMRSFVAAEVSRLIERAYRDVSGLGPAHTARLVEALLATSVDARLEPLRATLALDDDRFSEGIFSWKGFLYYKWMITQLWRPLGEVGDEISRLVITGPRDIEGARYVDLAKQRLRQSVMVERQQISRSLRIYEEAFDSLVRGGRPQRFRDFLLQAPDLFIGLGERVGMVSHIVSFWRYRFPPGEPMRASIEDAVDILHDFESGLAATVDA